MVILNLPTTVENCMPNQFADELEYFLRKLPGRERAIISLHPHNDRGCGVATTAAGLLAGGLPGRQRRAHRQRGHDHRGNEYVCAGRRS